MRYRQERRNLRYSPLALVLAEVRFPPVLKIEEMVPDIQEQLRVGGFPRFVKAFGQEISFAPGEGPRITTSSRWLFGTKSDDEHVILTNTSVAIQTTKYSNFERFSDRLESVIATLAGVVSPSYAERIGLRYFNVIETKEDDDINDYINPTMRALSADVLGADDVHWTVETLARIALGQLRVRLAQQTNAPALPFDLLTPELSSRYPSVAEKTTGLDIDCSSEESVDFEASALLATFWSLHYYTDKAFLASVTRQALAAWGEQNEVAE